MNPPPPQPKIQLINTAEYREGYANSVQIRVNLWDFLLLFGVINQSIPAGGPVPSTFLTTVKFVASTAVAVPGFDFSCIISN